MSSSSSSRRIWIARSAGCRPSSARFSTSAPSSWWRIRRRRSRWCSTRRSSSARASAATRATASGYAPLSPGLASAVAAWIEALAAGFLALAERYGVEVIGGDTSRAAERTISIVALGEVPAGVALYRSGAKAGDDIWVSGELGGAALGLRRPDIAEAARRLHEPEPRIELGERLRGLAHAAIDISDGLTGDLQHIL